MAKKRNTKGSFLPEGQTHPSKIIRVNDPALAEFLKDLQGGGGGSLTADINATENVGGVDAPYLFEAGTPLEDILRQILEGVPTAGLTSFQLLDASQSLIGNTPKIAGDEYTIGGIRFMYTDPADTVDVIVYAPGSEATEDVTPPAEQGVTQAVDVATDYTAGGNASDFAYTFAQGGNASFAKLNAGFTLTMKDAEGNTVGQAANASLTWTPPAFMLNILEGNGTSFAHWTLMSTVFQGGQFATNAALILPALATYLQADYYPIIRHSANGSYRYADSDWSSGQAQPVTWSQPNTISDTEQVGLGDTGSTTTFFDANIPYRQVWFIPAGGQVQPSGALFTDITAGGGSYSPNVVAATADIDISQAGLGLSTSGTSCPITYRLFVSPQTNSVSPGGTPIQFNG